MRRKIGISLMLPTQNAERTVEACIKSFYDFADEIIVVDNGSSDRTIEICSDLSSKLKKVEFYNKPLLKDLYENRQFAFEKTNYKWIARLDSDYIAYTEGHNNITNLRDLVLKTKTGIRPIAYGIKQVALYYDKYHTRIRDKDWKTADSISEVNPIESLNSRIIQYYPGLKFIRRKRWEGIRFNNFLKHIQLDNFYWFHCEFKSDSDFFIRSERTNWRELGDFKKFPTLKSYIESILIEKYHTDNFEIAVQKYMKNYYHKLLRPYSEDKYYKYPTYLNIL